MTAQSNVSAQSKEVGLVDSEGWQWLTQQRDAEQKFPGLEVQAEHADKSHKLKVSEQLWRMAPDICTDRVVVFLQKLAAFLNEAGSPAVQACLDPDTSAFMLDFVTATKLYRQVPHLSSGQSKLIIQQAQEVFELLQRLVRDFGPFLMLRFNGWRVPRRIILFSRPSEIFGCCFWLFERQEDLHEGFKGQMSSSVHSKCADLLAATVGQLLHYDDQLQPDYCKPLQALKDHFEKQDCSRCFGAMVKQQVDLVLMKCGAEHVAHQLFQKGIYTAPRPAGQNESTRPGSASAPGGIPENAPAPAADSKFHSAGISVRHAPAPISSHSYAPSQSSSDATTTSRATPSTIGSSSSDSSTESLLATLSLSAPASRFDKLVLDDLEHSIHGFMGTLKHYADANNQNIQRVQQLAFGRLLQMSDRSLGAKVFQGQEAGTQPAPYDARPQGMVYDTSPASGFAGMAHKQASQWNQLRAAAPASYPQYAQDPGRADKTGRW